MGQNSQELGRKYWATRLSVRSHGPLFRCLRAPLRSLARCAHSLARSLRSLPRSWESGLLMSQNDQILSHSAGTGCDYLEGHGEKRCLLVLWFHCHWQGIKVKAPEKNTLDVHETSLIGGGQKIPS